MVVTLLAVGFLVVVGTLGLREVGTGLTAFGKAVVVVVVDELVVVPDPPDLPLAGKAMVVALAGGAEVATGAFVVVDAEETMGADRIIGTAVDVVEVATAGSKVSGAEVAETAAPVAAGPGGTVELATLLGSSPLLIQVTTWAKLVGLPFKREAHPGTS